jgi:hypothetical protein
MRQGIPYCPQHIGRLEKAGLNIDSRQAGEVRRGVSASWRLALCEVSRLMDFAYLENGGALEKRRDHS